MIKREVILGDPQFEARQIPHAVSLERGQRGEPHGIVGAALTDKEDVMAIGKRLQRRHLGRQKGRWGGRGGCEAPVRTVKRRAVPALCLTGLLAKDGV